MAFVNLQRLMSLNAGKGDEMAQKAIDKDGALTAGAEAAARLHGGGLGNGAEAANRVTQAQERAKVLGNASGNAFDAALMGGSSAMQQYQARTKNLTKMLGDAQYQHVARQKHAANMQPGAAPQQIQAPESEAEKQARLQREQWKKGGYNPQGADAYAAYSDWAQTGRR